MLFKAMLKGCESPPARWGKSNLQSLLTKCPFATMDGDPLLSQTVIFFLSDYSAQKSESRGPDHQ